MCGIAGTFNYRTQAPVDAHLMERMCDLLAHRGPDGHGVWVDGAVGFGHRRLAVIDTSREGRQPRQTADGRLTITFNGEIYNFADLRRTLEQRGSRFVSRTDTEVILEAYRHYGVDCVAHLRGMFAFAIWDADARTLFAARDRVGKKPFYFREDADGFIFASEPKAFLADPAFTPQADAHAVTQYLSLQYVPSPLSAFRGVHRLPPAHYLLVTDRGWTQSPYWRLHYTPKTTTTEADAVEQIHSDLAEATRLRMISDVPLGAFLSGGIDSSLVVALMARHGGGRVKTFSIGFEEADYNELSHARVVADHIGTEHFEAIVRPDALEVLPRLTWHYGEPFADSSAIPTMYLAAMTRRHVTVALTGDGGDESFGGYERYLAAQLGSWLDVIPRNGRAGLARSARHLPAGRFAQRARRFLEAAADPPAHRYGRWMFHFDDGMKSTLCAPEFLAAAGPGRATDLFDELWRTSDAQDLVDRLMDIDVRSYLPDDLLVKVDIATMAYGLEARSPLLDHVVMERAATLPATFKVRRTVLKHLLKSVARPHLPPAIIDRPKKGFGVPIDHWFRTSLKEFAVDTLTSRRFTQRGYFRQAEVDRLLNEHMTGTRSRHYHLWNLVVLEMWHQMFIDRRPTGPPADLQGVQSSWL